MSEELENIEKYLSGTLNEEERKAFESRLESDTDFAKSVEALRLAMEGIHNFGLRQELKEIGAEMNEELLSFKRKNPKRVWLFIGGVAATLTILIAVLHYLSQTSSTTQLFQSYFQPYPNLITTRSSDQSDIKEAFQNYSHQNFKEALKGFESAVLERNRNDTLLFYAGVSALADGTHEKAIDYLSALSEIKSEFNQQGNWYLALAYVLGDDIEEARQILNRIRPDEYEYRASRELLELLD
ncbi:hypothetical protein QQ008_10670 [Fulvivirgaceae bacterium BMA10]|uniref:Tetratricopeptide repeat protein n=1 Tax=Splendidivirga corallicola TaxID=3051826 RepID=A0ABT8KM99_9BACT|nr:hypothetical protein [Fulvivirgaceae bacterium BMA10]